MSFFSFKHILNIFYDPSNELILIANDIFCLPIHNIFHELYPTEKSLLFLFFSLFSLSFLFFFSAQNIRNLKKNVQTGLGIKLKDLKLSLLKFLIGSNIFFTPFSKSENSLLEIKVYSPFNNNGHLFM